MAHGVVLSTTDVETNMAFLDKLPDDASTSMQRDVAAGRPSELEAWKVAIVRLARQKHLDVPINECIYAGLKPQERRARGEVPGRSR